MEEYSVFAPHVSGTYAHPYAAQIVGEHPTFRFERRFLRLDWPESTPGGRWFDVKLPCDGVYECCVRRFKSGTNKVIDREYEWFVLFDGEFYEIDKEDVLFALFNLQLQTDRMREVS